MPRGALGLFTRNRTRWFPAALWQCFKIYRSLAGSCNAGCVFFWHFGRQKFAEFTLREWVAVAAEWALVVRCRIVLFVLMEINESSFGCILGYYSPCCRDGCEVRTPVENQSKGCWWARKKIFSLAKTPFLGWSKNLRKENVSQFKTLHFYSWVEANKEMEPNENKVHRKSQKFWSQIKQCKLFPEYKQCCS